MKVRNNQSKLTLDYFVWNGKKLEIGICKESINSDIIISFLLKNRKTKTSITLDYSFDLVGRTIKYTIPVNQLETLTQGRWDFYSKYKTNNKTVVQRLGFFDSPVASKVIRYQKPIYNKGENAFIPYITEKNGLSINCNNLMNLQSESYNVIRKVLKIKQANIINNKLILHFKSPLEHYENAKILLKHKDLVKELPFIIDKEKKTLIIMIQNISTDINWNIYLTTLYGDIVEENRLDFQISMKNNLAINKIKVSQPKNNLEDYSKSQISVEGLRNDSNSILFNIKSSEFLNAKNIVFYIKRRKSKEKFILQVEKECSENKTQIKIPIGQLNEIINYTSRWDLYLELHYEGFKTEKRIGLYYRNSTSISKKCTDFFNVTKTIGVSVYITNDNEVSFYFSTKEQYTNSIYHTDLRLVNFKWKGETISFTARLKVKETNNFHVESVLLRNRKDKEQIIKAPIDREVQKENNSRVVKISMNLNNEEFEQFYWDFFLELCIDGDKKKLVRVKNNNYLIRRKLKYKLFKFNIKRNNYILYPYLTQNDCLSLTYREMGEYEAPKYKVNEYFAYYIYILFYWYFKAKPTWLIYEKFSETAQDNSFYFFKYCYENHYDKKVYYVIKKDSPDARNLQPYKGRVVYFMSIKHLILLLGSNLLVASETKGHSYAWRVNKGKVIDILNKKRYVFLQHGVLGLKIIDNIFKPNSTNGAELFVVSSKFEKDIVKKHLGYDDNNIIVTGLARWDAITAQTSHNKQKEIFLMPTWRNWLEETEVDTFLESDYYKEYSSLLQSKDLAKELDRNNIILNFYLHPKFKPFIEDFKSYSPNIRIINFGEEKINDLIMRASLLITDYSSVAWEMYYQKKPVLFFHFDLNKYIDKQGSYMDLKKDLFGDVAYNSHELTIKILAYIKNGFQEDNRFSKNRKDYFEYVDNHNSKRIYNEIIKREKELLNNSTKLSDKLKDSYLIRYLWNKYNKKPLIYNMGYRLYNRLK